MVGLDKAKLVEAFKKRVDGERLPLFTLAEFFVNNDEEDSIAPNQWGYGRPTLAEIWKQLKKIENHPDVAWVRVALHGDTDVGVRDGEFVYEIAGDTIVICTTIKASEIEEIADCERLCSDGVNEYFDSEWYTEIPDIPAGYRVLTLCWD